MIRRTIRHPPCWILDPRNAQGTLNIGAVPQDSLCNRRFLPSPRPSPCKGEGGEGASPQPSPCKGEGAIIPQELLWLCTSDAPRRFRRGPDRPCARSPPYAGGRATRLRRRGARSRPYARDCALPSVPLFGRPPHGLRGLHASHVRQWRLYGRAYAPAAPYALALRYDVHAWLSSNLLPAMVQTSKSSRCARH